MSRLALTTDNAGSCLAPTPALAPVPMLHAPATRLEVPAFMTKLRAHDKKMEAKMDAMIIQRVQLSRRTPRYFHGYFG